MRVGQGEGGYFQVNFFYFVRFLKKLCLPLLMNFYLCFRAAPRLKDAPLSESKIRELYTQCIQMMRTLYQECRLVHADLSEYNML